MYNNKKTSNNNEINNTNEDIIINEEEKCKGNSEEIYEGSDKNLEEVIENSTHRCTYTHLQLLFCVLAVLIIVFNKYVFNNQSLNEAIVREITHETTEDEIQNFINSILDIKNP